MKSKIAISELASAFGLELVGSDIEVSGASLSAASCQPGDLFIAVQGAKHHGLDFLAEAIEHGAVAVLSDHKSDCELPQLLHDRPRAVAGDISSLVYASKDASMRIFGVTGTNGKTSTTNYLHQLLNAIGKPAGMSASTSRIVGSEIRTASLTSPEVTELHSLLADMRASGQFHAAVEVSAQALIRNRVDGLRFSVVGFTNLSRDHLDDFDSMADYLAAKQQLFTSLRADRAVILVEDEYAKTLFENCEIDCVGIGDQLDYQYRYEPGQLLLSGKHVGRFRFGYGSLMAKNLVLALVMLIEDGVEVAALERALEEIELYVPGRLELVSTNRPHVYVDYAHTPAGVAGAVEQIRQLYPNLTVILGASGNRDKGKRSEMALAATSADLLIVTDQHPRDEDAGAIRHALLEAARSVLESERILEIADPATAIQVAVANTDKAGAILWCGPGHLTYREIRGEKVAFNAIELARRAVLE